MPRVLRYILERPCGLIRGMSVKCVTAFALDQCGAVLCDGTPPTVICVTPGRNVPILPPGFCSLESEVELPPLLIAGISATHGCPCASPPVGQWVLSAVGDADLFDGEAVRWQGDWFRWDYTDESCWGSFGVPPLAYWFRIRFAVVIMGSGSGLACSELRVYCEVDGHTDEYPSDFPCEQPLYRQTIGAKSIVTVDDLSPISVNGLLSGFSFACETGPMAGGEPIYFCGWSGTTPQVHPDHYGTLSVTEPEE